MKTRSWIVIVAVAVFVAGTLAGGIGYRAGRNSVLNDMAGAAGAAQEKLKDNPTASAILGAGFAQADEQSTRLKSASKLLHIGFALVAYSNTHGGAGPATLAELVQNGGAFDADALVCPLPGVRYVYRGYHAKPEDPLAVVVYEEGNPGFSNVLLGDGVVKPIRGEAVSRLVATGRAEPADLK